jgi:hypothetical protein
MTRTMAEDDILALVIRADGSAMLIDGDDKAIELSVAETVKLTSALVARRCKREVHVPLAALPLQ